MTNESLAALIGEGGNDELLPLLWEKMRRFYRKISKQYVVDHAERCVKSGVTYEDILQESYFAMLEAITAYNSRSSEQAALHFVSFCGYPFRNRAAALVGIRTASARKEPLNCAAFSLDEPVQNDDGEMSYAEIIPDETAEEPFREIEQADYCRDIRDTVQAALSDRPRELEVIERLYYAGETLAGAGAMIGISTERVRQLRQRALRLLYNDSRLRELYGISPYRHVGVNQFRNCGSIVEQIAEKHESYCRRMQKVTADKYNA